MATRCRGAYGRTMGTIQRSLTTFVLVVLVALGVTGCGTHFPADPDGTLDRVSGGVLRVGVSPHEPFTTVSSADPSGSEVALVEAYAESIAAQVVWRTGGEEQLVTQLQHGRLDVVIGGLTDKTPWRDQAGLTRPYTESVDEFGQTRQHVMAAPRGENAFLLSLDTFLQDEGDHQG